MKRQLTLLAAGMLTASILTACGQDPAITAFKEDIDTFCTTISEIDTSINNIDAESENAASELLEYLDDLEISFQEFAELNFPEEFDYLENIADESSSYMTEAVKTYHDVYSSGHYDTNKADYAKENYSRAYKRVQIIITFLHGEEPEDIDLTIVSGEEESAFNGESE